MDASAETRAKLDEVGEDVVRRLIGSATAADGQQPLKQGIIRTSADTWITVENALPWLQEKEARRAEAAAEREAREKQRHGVIVFWMVAGVVIGGFAVWLALRANGH